ncbi:MAG TPA: hypothetical protein VHU84_00765 [Lacipirellulaceae bacterium]|nr:hypothetical protein [Lacipirellulaceae bacterium]
MSLLARSLTQFRLCLFLVVCCAGCSKGRAPPRGAQPYPVHGKVNYQGKPASGFQVAFNPLVDQPGQPSPPPR